MPRGPALPDIGKNFQEKKMFATIHKIGLTLAGWLLGAVLSTVQASETSAGETLPYETWLQTLQESLTGPVAFSVAVMGIVSCGATLIFMGGEIGRFMRSLIYIVLVMTLLVGANSLMTRFFNGAMVTSDGGQEGNFDFGVLNNSPARSTGSQETAGVPASDGSTAEAQVLAGALPHLEAGVEKQLQVQQTAADAAAVESLLRLNVLSALGEERQRPDAVRQQRSAELAGQVSENTAAAAPHAVGPAEAAPFRSAAVSGADLLASSWLRLCQEEVSSPAWNRGSEELRRFLFEESHLLS